MDGKYTYRPLTKPCNIRLFVLQPAGKLNDPLVGSLEEVALEHASSTALSYSWAMEDDRGYLNYDDNWISDPGVSTACKPLLVHGVPVFIAENLHNALRRLREKSPSPARLWIDAVCINQRDDAEKSVQVAIMGSLYKHAARVIAWLGEGTDQINAAAKMGLQCLVAEQKLQNQQDFHEEADYLHSPPWYFTHSWNPDHALEAAPSRPECKYCHFNTPIPQDRILTALNVLRNRRYFTRLWVVQEMAIPSADRLTFQFGSYTLLGNPLELMRDRWYIFPVSVIANSSWSHTPYNPRSEDKSFERWVSYGTDKQCFDPRDRLFALLGCCPTTTIQPDYTRTLAEVYRDFARYLLTDRDIMSIMTNVGSLRENSEGFSSWIPDLRWRMFGGKLLVISRREKEMVWNYAQPALSGDGMVLSCYLDFLGTVFDDDDFRDQMSGLEDQHDAMPEHGIGMPIIQNAIASEFIEYIQPGDIICKLECHGYSPARLALRQQSRKPDLWRIVASWNSIDSWQDWSSERRRYHII